MELHLVAQRRRRRRRQKNAFERLVCRMHIAQSRQIFSILNSGWFTSRFASIDFRSNELDSNRMSQTNYKHKYHLKLEFRKQLLRHIVTNAKAKIPFCVKRLNLNYANAMMVYISYSLFGWPDACMQRCQCTRISYTCNYTLLSSSLHGNQHLLCIARDRCWR